MTEVSTVRMYALTLLYLLNFVGLGLTVWSAGQWDARAAGLTRTFLIPVVLDLLVIPWAYVYANYVKKPGDSWKLPRVFRKAKFAGGR